MNKLIYYLFEQWFNSIRRYLKFKFIIMIAIIIIIKNNVSGKIVKEIERSGSVPYHGKPALLQQVK
jgi:hypothetical protein